MATFANDLRLKEIATGDEDGTWGTSTNTNLSLIADAFSLGTKEMAADADETFTMPDATADGTRSLYLKITSATSLSTTRTVTLAPNTVSKVWIIENATTGSQSITISQGSGGSVTVTNGSKVMVVTDGAGAGAAVTNANPTAAAQVYPGAGVAVSTGSAWGTSITLGTGVSTWLTTPSSANLAAAVTGETGSGALVFAESPVLQGAKDTVYALSGTALDPANGAIQTKTLAAITTFTDSLTSGSSMVLMLEGGSTYAVTWPTTTWVTANGNTAPTLTAKDSVAFWKVGTTLYSAYVGSYA